EEIYRCTVENVSLEHGYVFIPFGKTRAARRRIPLTSSALRILKRRVEAAKGIYLFPHRKRPNKPMLKVNNAHEMASPQIKSPSISPLRFAAHVGDASGRGG